MLSSSISFYSALALAPFILILLWIASLVGQDVQKQIIDHAADNFSSQVGEMIQMVFNNINQGVSIGSVSGIIGFVVILWSCSLVFLQFRYSFDVIYGHHSSGSIKTWTEFFLEKLFAMLIVLMAAVLLILSFAMVAVVEYLVAIETGTAVLYRTLVFLLNFLLYVGLFSLIHYFTPSRRQHPKLVIQIASLSSIFFILGNLLLTYYLKGFARSSVYGAAGTLLVFLIWAYYSAFTIFLSVEVFVHFRRRAIS